MLVLCFGERAHPCLHVLCCAAAAEEEATTCLVGRDRVLGSRVEAAPGRATEIHRTRGLDLRNVLATDQESTRRAREVLAWIQLLSVAAGGTLVVSRFRRRIRQGLVYLFSPLKSG